MEIKKKVKILSGCNEVIESGTIQSNGLQDISFLLSEKPRMEIIVRVVFNGKEPNIRFEGSPAGKITFFFENPTGINYGFSTPLKIGDLRNRDLFISFRLNVYGENSSYELNYTFTLAGGKND